MPRVLIYSLVYPPDGVSTAQLLGELADELVSRGTEIRVVTSVPIYRTSEAAHSGTVLRRRALGLFHTSRQGDIDVWHVTCPSGTGRLSRLASWILMHTVGAVLALTVSQRGTIFFVPSPLLTLGLVARVLARFRRGRLVYNAQELQPDLVVDMGYIRSPVLIRLLRWVELRVYAGATAVTAITPDMTKRIRERDPETRVETIPNFVDLDFLRPLERSNPFSREHGLEGCQVVSYAGVIGPAQGLGALLDIAEAFPAEANILTVFIGEGRSRTELEERVRRDGAGRVRFIDHHPFARVPEIYASSDLSVVCLSPGASTSALPSKLLRIMACGRPVLAICPDDAELAREVRRAGAGIAVPPDRPHESALRVLELLKSPDTRDSMGRAGRRYVEERYSRSGVGERYHELLESIVPTEPRA